MSVTTDSVFSALLGQCVFKSECMIYCCFPCGCSAFTDTKKQYFMTVAHQILYIILLLSTTIFVIFSELTNTCKELHSSDFDKCSSAVKDQSPEFKPSGNAIFELLHATINITVNHSLAEKTSDHVQSRQKPFVISTQTGAVFRKL